MTEPTTSKAPATGAMDKEMQIPEWENAAIKNDKTFATGARAAITSRFDSVLPPYKRYLGLKRKTFLLVFLVVTLALVALIIGLSVGLSHDHSHSSTLPLPSDTQTFTGDLTYYAPGLGACGTTSTASENIVAVSHLLFDAAGSTSSNGGNSNSNPLCGKMLRIRRFDQAVGEERSVDLRVVDRCTGCGERDLDTSLSAFERVAQEAEGRVVVTWAWLGSEGTGG
ncbi:expansin-related protein [Teratosphaeria destructans]|uniref:Expansin-related protein n=1 Tax=Teratosphaeria destructans TaxID=418781 RepID=A0A9W7T0A4_9PEZI|nr:expansin-related protein [Teratosphaeria destructans]